MYGSQLPHVRRIHSAPGLQSIDLLFTGDGEAFNVRSALDDTAQHQLTLEARWDNS